MLQLFRPQPLPIGLDVGSESVKLLQLAVGPTGPAVAAAVRVPVPPDAKGDPDKRVAFAGTVLRDALRRRGGVGGPFRGPRVVAALPKDVVHYKTHRLPPMPPAELSLAARIDARDLFRFDPDSADVQCLDAGDVRHGGERRREVILVAAGKRYVDDFVRTLHRAGARVASLEVEPCAVHRAASRVAGGGGGSGGADDAGQPPQVLIDLGAAQSRVLIRRGQDVRLVKVIDVGADHLRAAVSRKLGLPPAEAEQLRRRAAASVTADRSDGVRKVIYDATRHAVELLAREVLACVRYHAVTFRGPAPTRADLVGGEAGDPQVRSIVAAALGVPAGPLDLFAGIDTGAIAAADRTPALGEWAVVLGLALKGVAPFASPNPAREVTTTPDESRDAGGAALVSSVPAAATPVAGGGHA